MDGLAVPQVRSLASNRWSSLIRHGSRPIFLSITRGSNSFKPLPWAATALRPLIARCRDPASFLSVYRAAQSQHFLMCGALTDESVI
jgi:hypothetical protein